MDPFLYEGLTLQDKIDLGHSTEMPGFGIIKKLLDSACQQTVRAVIKLDPEDPDFESKLKIRQLTARLTNDICATLLKSIVMHTEAARIESAVNSVNAVDTTEALKPLGDRFGSIAIKPRKAAQQDNQ